MPWAFTVFDEKFREQELTLGQAEQIEELMSYVDAKGVAVRPNWYEINPARSATAASAIAAVMYANRAGIDPKEALSKVHELTVPEFVDDVDLNDVDDLPTVVMNGFPPEAGEPSTDD